MNKEDTIFIIAILGLGGFLYYKYATKKSTVHVVQTVTSPQQQLTNGSQQILSAGVNAVDTALGSIANKILGNIQSALNTSSSGIELPTETVVYLNN